MAKSRYSPTTRELVERIDQKLTDLKEVSERTDKRLGEELDGHQSRIRSLEVSQARLRGMGSIANYIFTFFIAFGVAIWEWLSRSR